MKKRAQFYLVAAFVIVIIIIGLNQVYNSISTTKEKTIINDLAEEAHYEAEQIANAGAGINNLQQLVKYYAKKYPSIQMSIIYGDKLKADIIETDKITDASGKETISYLGRDFQMTSAKSLYVLLISEKDDEKTVVVR